MPDASIVIKAEDRYSEAVKKMAAATQGFGNNVGGLTKKLEHLTQNKAELKIDTRQARQALREAEKQFDKTGDASARLELSLAQGNYDKVARNLREVTRAANETERAISRAANQAGGGGGHGGGRGGAMFRALSQMGQAGLFSMAGDLAGQWANTLAGSALGSAGGTLFGSALSGIGSGAAIGSMIAPGIGTAVGALAGGTLGLVGGGAQIYEQRDSAFKGYVQGQVEGQLAAQEQSRATGSALAAGREMDQISLATLYGSEQAAADYLKQLVDLANRTPFLYGDLVSLSKAMAPYGWNEKTTLPDLTTIGDAGAALGWQTDDMAAVSRVLGLMKKTGKTQLDYLNAMTERGIDATGYLGAALGVDQGTVYDMISKGQIAGQDAARIILEAMTGAFTGAMERQSTTFGGLSSTVEGLTQEQDNAMGRGYNSERKKGLQAQIDYSSIMGQQEQEAYEAVGAFQASLENAKEKYIRDEKHYTMTKDREFLKAQAKGDGETMGRLLMEAEIRGVNKYNASEGAQLMLESEKSLIQSVREDASVNETFWDTGYQRGQEYSRGLADGMAHNGTGPDKPAPMGMANYGRLTSRHAYGLDYVPHDNFPAILHEGERVLTASEARQADRGGGNITINVSGMTVREDADIDRIAGALYERIRLAEGRG